MSGYVTFLLDLVGEGEDGPLVGGTLRFAPEPGRVPGTAFIWKVVCDGAGRVVVRALDRKRLVVLGLARWDDGLKDRRQQGERPTPYQWQLVEEGIARARRERAARGEVPAHAACGCSMSSRSVASPRERGAS